MTSHSGCANRLLMPDWPAPPAVRALTTTRRGGASRGAWQSFNLADHVGDEPGMVAANRRLLMAKLGARVGSAQWLNQVHGTDVVLAQPDGVVRTADACYTRRAGVVCAVLTADCLPVLLCDRSGTVVAAAHAGWRGLAAGVLGRTVRAMGARPKHLLAWLGPAIGDEHFEVGAEVRAAFLAQVSDRARRAAIDACFRPSSGRSAHYLGDLCQLARLALAELGVSQVFGGDYCTYRDAEHFYSYRRDGVTGRMASLIWLDGVAPGNR